uniref:Uncharacterized protein n=1 Tax=Cucumis melo TaxID=3656 RepID=A0A9I9DYY8_CUCME
MEGDCRQREIVIGDLEKRGRGSDSRVISKKKKMRVGAAA